MPSTSDSLFEIPLSEWPKLRQLYADQKLSSCAFNMLQTTINSIQKNSELDVTIYALNGDWSDGTFIMDDHAFITFNTLSDNQERLLAALNCLDINGNYLFYGFPGRLLPTMKQYFSHSGLKFDEYNLVSSLWYHIPREQILEFVLDSPPGVTLTSLDPIHAEAINAIRPYKMDDSVKFIERLIRHNEGVGAFNAGGQLMAWCLQIPIGCIGMLQVVEEHKNKGLDSLVVRNLSKKLAAKNMEVMVPVVFENIVSPSLFENLNARIVDNVYWAWKDE